MPLYKEWTGANETRVAFWKIEEDEAFFFREAGLRSDKKFEKRRLEHVASRYLLQLTAPSLSLDHIVVKDSGRPYHPQHALSFSISHSFPYVAVATSSAAHIGLDIELCREKILRLHHKFLSAEELALFGANIPGLTLAWSAKEAGFKWYELGGIDFIQDMPLVSCSFTKKNEAAIRMDFCKDPVNRTILEIAGGIEPEFAWAVTTNK